MLRKLAESLTNNLGLKILSVLSSIALWLIVMNIDDPFVTRPFTVPVEIINQEVLEARGEVYEVQNGSDMAVIDVRGRRSDMDRVSFADFTATADLNQINFAEHGEMKHVPIVVRANRNPDHFTITRITENLLVTLEDLEKQSFNVRTEQIGTLSGSYAIGQITPTPNIIEVSGPASLVSLIDRIVASVDVENLEGNTDIRVPVVIYDEDGNPMESERLKLSQEEVTVNIEILRTKEIPILAEVGGIPAEGFRMVGVDIVPATVEIMGDASALEDFDEIVIPETTLNIDGATENVEFTINIREYLSEDVELTNREREEVAVNVLIEGLAVRTIDIPVSAITIQNLREGLEISFGVPFVTASFQGLGADLDQLNGENMQAYINVEGMGVGTYEQPVLISISGEVQVQQPVTVGIQIAEEGDLEEEVTIPPLPPSSEPETTSPGTTTPPGTTLPPGTVVPPPINPIGPTT